MSRPPRPISRSALSLSLTPTAPFPLPLCLSHSLSFFVGMQAVSSIFVELATEKGNVPKVTISYFMSKILAQIIAVFSFVIFLVSISTSFSILCFLIP